MKPCTTCKGRGSLYGDECPTCGGDGEVTDPRGGRVFTPDPVLAAAEATCIECGEVGHLDCGLRDPEIRRAAPTYAAAMRMIGGVS